MSQRFTYGSMGGGVNKGASSAAIANSQLADMANWYTFETKLRRRGGTRPVTTVAWGSQINSMSPLKKSDGSWVLIVGGPTSFGRLDGTGITNIGMSGGLTIGSSALPWNFFQYKNFLYAIRNGSFLRLSADTAALAGIDAPAAAPVIAQGAAGVLAAANYTTVYTYGNRATGYESNPSSASNILALAGSKKIDYSSIGISPNSFVDMRRIYRTLPDQTGVYFFVDQINDNITTTYIGDNFLPANLGATVSFNNATPPAGLKIGTVWQDRGFTSDGKSLFYSEFLMMEAFGLDSVIDVFPDDGHTVRGLLPFGDRLMIGKTNKIHYLIGNTKSNFALHTLSDVHGCMSGASWQTAEGAMFWYGSGKTVYRSDAITVRDISSPRVKPYLDAIPDALEEQVVGAIFPALNWYVLSIPQTGYTTNRVVLVYNYKYDTWSVFTHPSDAPQFIGNFFNSAYGHVLYSTFYDGQIYLYNDSTYGREPNGAIITATGTTKADDFGMPGTRKSFEQAWFLIPQTAGGQMLLEVLRDELTTPVVSRTVTLDIPNSAWKAYKLPTWGAPGTKLQMRFSYTGDPAIDIDQIVFDVAVMHRGPTQPY